MLDYTLVSTKATYRMPTPRDLPRLVRLVQAFYREDQRGAEKPAEQVLATVSELGRSKEKGSVFVFERDGELAGYAILVYSWSNELGGTVLSVDELYIDPALRRQGIASDFLGLLRKVVPEGIKAIQLEVSRSNRPALALYRTLGFQDTGRQVHSLPIEEK
jgi:ribosomal protein S18 acetylase RimI-like enzyme